MGTVKMVIMSTAALDTAQPLHLGVLSLIFKIILLELEGFSEILYSNSLTLQMKKLGPGEVKLFTRSPVELISSITMTNSPGLFLRSQE